MSTTNRKRKHDLTYTDCSSHGNHVLSWKDGACRQCTTVNCAKCGPNSLAYTGLKCIVCSAASAKRYHQENKEKAKTNVAVGNTTHIVTSPCKLEKHSTNSLRNVDGQCYFCYKNTTCVMAAKKRVRKSSKNLGSVEITRERVYELEGTLCSICSRPVVQIEEKYAALSFTLDRTDPSDTYTVQNTTAMHCQCNMLKGEDTIDVAKNTLCKIHLFHSTGAQFTAVLPPDPKLPKDSKNVQRDLYAKVTAEKRGRSKKTGVTFLHGREFTKTLATMQHGQCALCGDMLNFDISFDQKIAGNGYTSENTQLVHLRCNHAKGAWPLQTLLDLAQAVYMKTISAKQ